MIAALRLLVLATLRFMRSAPGSAFSVFAGVVIGIISIAGVHILGERIGESLASARPAWLEGVTHVVTRDDLDVNDYARLRIRWRQGQLAGTTAVVPVHEFVTAEGVRVVGTDWLQALDGAPLPDGVALSGNLLDRDARGEPAMVTGLPHQAGDLFQVNGVRLRVIASGSASGERVAPMVFVDLATAYAISGQSPQRLDAIFLSVTSPFARLADLLERIMPGISAGLPATPAPSLPGYEVRPVATELPTEGLIRAVLFNLGALGSLSLLVALLLMYQTATVWLRRQQAVFRSLFEVGVPVRLLAGGFIGALCLLAVPAILLGLLCGERLASLLQSVVLGSGVPEMALPGSAAVTKCVIAGGGVALAGGAIAWWREWPRDGGTRSLHRAFVILSATILLAAVAGWWVPDTGLAGIFLCILVVSLGAAFCGLPLLRRMRGVVERLRGPLWMRLGLREAGWYPEDLGVACAALALAVAVSIGVGSMVESFRREFSALLDARLAPDLLVTVPPRQDAIRLAAMVSDLPGVTAVVLSGETIARIRGLPVVVGFTRFDAAQSARYGHPRALAPGEVLVNETLAAILDTAVGDTVPVGRSAYRVAGVFKGYGETGLRLLVDVAEVGELLGRQPGFSRVSVDADDPGVVRDALRAVDGLEVSVSADVRARSMAIFDRTFATSDALTWLALVIASAALLNALAGFRLSQQATGRLLDAIGVGAAFNLGASLVRALVVGGVAVMIAVPLGIWLGFILCSEVNPRAFGWTLEFQLLPVPVLLPVLLALCASLIAGAAGGFTRLPGVRR